MFTSRFTNLWKGDPYDNLFLNKQNHHRLFCDTFPLMPLIEKMDKFDFKKEPFIYDHLLEEFESELNFFFEDSSNVFYLESWQKIYLKDYLNFLYMEFHDFIERN